MRRAIIVITVLLIAGIVFLNHHSSPEDRTLSLSGSTMGTTYHLKIEVPSGMDLSADELSKRIKESLNQVDHLMSTYKPDSEVSQFNQVPINQWLTISQPTFHVIDAAIHYSQLSNGAFDITVGKLVNLWGFGPTINASLVPDPQTIQSLQEKIGYSHLQLQNSPPSLKKTSEDIYLDLSAIAKGYAVDAVATVLDLFDLHNYMVEIGGEIRTSGSKLNGSPWSIGIESPLIDQHSIQKVLHLNNVAMATSGDYRNYFEHDGKRFSHTIDPRTGYPITHKLASVTVIAPTCMDADALATTIMVMGPDEGMTFAEENHLPIFMIIKNDQGFVEQSSTTFTPFLKK
jgi:thiamine biosynthesis lipoprotein